MLAWLALGPELGPENSQEMAGVVALACNSSVGEAETGVSLRLSGQSPKPSP